MELGTIIEYIDKQKIICAIVIENQHQRLRLFTENKKEVKIPLNRVALRSKSRLELSMGRERLAVMMKTLVERRRTIKDSINLEELWETVNTEQEWIDLDTLTELYFPEDVSDDHQSAMFRKFFEDRIFFKFNNDRFMPNHIEQVEKIRKRIIEDAKRERIIEIFSQQLKNIIENQQFEYNQDLTEADRYRFTDMLKSAYLFEKESPHYDIVRKILDNAGFKTIDIIFKVLVSMNIWSNDENLELYRFDIPVNFSEKIIPELTILRKSGHAFDYEHKRKDLTHLQLMTIDGQSTLDFDDALSLEESDGCYVLGVHIADVGCYVKRGGAIDQEALTRGSSIYLPDQRIPMLPSELAEDLCSLKAGMPRPAISIIIRLNRAAEILDYEISASVISVKNQLTYYDVNSMTDNHRELTILYDIAKNFREQRIQNGAIHISLPELNIWLNDNNEIIMNRVNRESPGRMLVSEIMIMANWLMARFLADHKMPAIFRTQAMPKNRFLKNGEGSLFQNWMQRKHLSRFILNTEPDLHSGLGLNAYVTATSPIRKYFDLLTQRQIRSILGLEPSIDRDSVEQSLRNLEYPMKAVTRVQFLRKRYWLLKYLETRIGEKTKAIVLNKRKDIYTGLIIEYLTECELPVPAYARMKPEDIVEVTIQHVNARKNILTVNIT